MTKGAAAGDVGAGGVVLKAAKALSIVILSDGEAMDNGRIDRVRVLATAGLSGSIMAKS